MNCKHCGGEIVFKDGVAYCTACNSTFEVENFNEKFDVYICYIESDPDGKRTKDSMVAQEAYKILRAMNVSAFYERISASYISGDDLEAVRYKSLYTAKAIIVVSTSIDNFNTLLTKFGAYFSDKAIIPFVSDIKPSEIPKKLSKFQALDYASIGWEKDLEKGILRVLGREEEIDILEIRKKSKRVRIIMICVCILFALTMIGIVAFVHNSIFKKGQERTVTEAETVAILSYRQIYDNAIDLVNEKKYLEAVLEFEKIPDYKDSTDRISEIYNRYDGYYQDEKQSCLFYLNIISGKSAEYSFEITVDNKILKAEDSLIIDDNFAEGPFIDNLANEGNITINLTNDSITINIKSDNNSGKTSIGEFSAQFRLEEKIDRPPEKTVTKELLLSWLTELTCADDITAAGFTLVRINEPGTVSRYDFPFGIQYVIENSSVCIITTNCDLPKYDGDGSYRDNEQKLETDVVVGIIAPVSLICAERVGQSSCVFTEDDIVYVPNAEKMVDYSEFPNFDVPWSDDNQTTMKEMTISSDSGIGLASKKTLGEYGYNYIVSEHEEIFYKSSVLYQYQEDNSTTNVKTRAEVYILAEKSKLILACVHEKYLNDDGMNYDDEGYFHYYKLDLTTNDCTFLAKHDQVYHINRFGSVVFDYGEWRESSDSNLSYFQDETTSSDIPADNKVTSYYADVNTNELNIRQGPGTNYEVVGSAYNGDELYIIAESIGQGSSSGWGKIDGDKGWIALDYVDKSE